MVIIYTKQKLNDSIMIDKYSYITGILSVSDLLIPTYSWGEIQIGFIFCRPSKLSGLST